MSTAKNRFQYDKPLRRLFLYNAIDFGTISDPKQIVIPSDIRCVKITDIFFNASAEAANGTTLSGRIQVGDGTTAAKYANQKVGPDATGTAVAKGASYGIKDLDGRVAAYNPDAAPGSGKGFIDLLQDGAAAGTLQQTLTVTFVANTGGTPAGIGEVAIEVEMW
jgi:hypothetical protein